MPFCTTVRVATAILAIGTGAACAKEVRLDRLSYQETSVALIVSTAAHAKASIGKTVRVEGSARDAKLSAVVVADRVIIYCLDVPSWPKDLAGKKVVVEGKLELSNDFEARVDADGARTAGTGGPIFVIRKSKPQLLP